LFHSDANPANNMGNFAKYATPVVANGKGLRRDVQQEGRSVWPVSAWLLIRRYRSRRVSRRRSLTDSCAPQASAALARRAGPDGLSDLNALTFSCPRAGLNAAARQAAKVPSQGTYQFAYFKIISGTHHAAYEVHFKSNYTAKRT
jgi:hypothetical protein